MRVFGCRWGNRERASGWVASRCRAVLSGSFRGTGLGGTRALKLREPSVIRRSKWCLNGVEWGRSWGELQLDAF